MNGDSGGTCTAFEGARRLATGDRATMARAIVEAAGSEPVLIFDDATGEQIEIDPRSAEAPIRGPGRPKLGVVAREVTLLPRHWDWLNGQPGGASVALRRLVEEARRANEGKDRVRRSREAAYRFLSAMGGNLPDFEEASRALFGGDREGFEARIADWPKDVRDYVRRLAAEAFEGLTP